MEKRPCSRINHVTNVSVYFSTVIACSENASEPGQLVEALIFGSSSLVNGQLLSVLQRNTSSCGVLHKYSICSVQQGECLRPDSLIVELCLAK